MPTTDRDSDPDVLRDELMRIAFAILGTREAAEDVVQDTLLRHVARTGPAPESPRAWLRLATRNLAIDRFRRTRLERETRRLWPDPRLAGGDVARPPDEELARHERVRESVRALLDGAVPRDVATVLLREWFGVGYAELARASGRGAAACRQAVHRALARARTRADERAPGRDTARGAPDDADGTLDRFVGALLEHESAPLFDALRVDAMLAAPAVPHAAPPTRASSARLRVDIDAPGARVSLVLGDVVLCEVRNWRNGSVSIRPPVCAGSRSRCRSSCRS